MNALKIRKKLDVPIPQLPELAPMIGKDVEIIVTEQQNDEPSSATGQSSDLLERLRSKLPGDPFGPEFEAEIRKMREGPWRGSDPLGEQE